MHDPSDFMEKSFASPAGIAGLAYLLFTLVVGLLFTLMLFFGEPAT